MWFPWNVLRLGWGMKMRLPYLFTRLFHVFVTSLLLLRQTLLALHPTNIYITILYTLFSVSWLFFVWIVCDVRIIMLLNYKWYTAYNVFFPWLARSFDFVELLLLSVLCIWISIVIWFNAFLFAWILYDYLCQWSTLSVLSLSSLTCHWSADLLFYR